jgi:uncharacterized protein involved in type VI secretion and phage assembly
VSLLVDSAAQRETESADQRIYGVVVAQVVDTQDTTNEGRVQIKFPWLPGVEPWARVAVLAAGNDQGTFFIPQTDHEVLVAFNHGDIREPFVIGCLWNGKDKPPQRSLTAPVSKRVIRTPKGHQILFDDEAQAIVISTKGKQKITIGPSKVEITTDQDKAMVGLDKNGKLSIRAEGSIELKADTIKLEGKKIDIKASTDARLDGGQNLKIQASRVNIN